MRVVDNSTQGLFWRTRRLSGWLCSRQTASILLELWSQSIRTITAYVIFNLPIFENVAVKVRAVVQRPVGCRSQMDAGAAWAASLWSEGRQVQVTLRPCVFHLHWDLLQHLIITTVAAAVTTITRKSSYSLPFSEETWRVSVQDGLSKSNADWQFIATHFPDPCTNENWKHLSRKLNVGTGLAMSPQIARHEWTAAASMHRSISWFSACNFLKTNQTHKSRFDLPFWFVFFTPANALAAEVEHGLDQWKDLAKTYGVDLILTAHRHIQEAGTKSLAKW